MGGVGLAGMTDEVGEYLAECAAELRRRGIDPTTYRASRAALIRRQMLSAAAEMDQNRAARLRRSMRKERKRAAPWWARLG